MTPPPTPSVPQRLGAQDQGARRGGLGDGAVWVGSFRRHGALRHFRGDEAGGRGVFGVHCEPLRGRDGVPRGRGRPCPGEGMTGVFVFCIYDVTCYFIYLVRAI